jgi:uncharacterized protein (DUF58 family)
MIEAVRALFSARMAAWVKRRQGADSLPVELHTRRLYILPTRAGLGFGVLLAAMLIAGLNYANSLALLLTFTLASLALVAMHLCHRNLLGLVPTDVVATPAFAGQHGRIVLNVANDSRLARFDVEMDALAATPAATDLPPHSSRRLELDVPVPTRGIVRIERLRLATTHPFGLFRAWAYLHPALAVIVYPRPHGSLPMPAHGAGTRSGGGRRGAGEDDEWLGLRPFREGDSPRQVAWKAYARGAPLLIKEYVASGAELRIFDFDELEGLPIEARLEQLARWVVDAEARGESYGLILPERIIEPDHGLEHRHRCLAALARHGIDER